MAADEDHDMDDQSDLDDESKGDIHFDGDSHLNGQDETAAESSTPTDYSLYDLPPRLAVLRQQLHDIEHQIELPKADFEAMLPYMDNVWRKLKSSEQTETSQNVELYWCKLRKAGGQKAHQPRPTPEGKQPRKRKPKDEKSCNMGMRVTYSTAPDKVTIRKTIPGERHTHDLDYMDSQKRNSGIMHTARKEAQRGFQPASIWWKMQEEQDKLEAAGGKFMKISDVRNVQYAWRQDNLDVALKAHTGYNASRTGPRQGSSTAQTKPKSSPQPVSATPTKQQPTVYQPPPPPPQRPPPQPPQQLQPPQSYQSQTPAGIYHYKPQPQSHPPSDVLEYPNELRGFLFPYLPSPAAIAASGRPHVTLTWAQSLDGRIASSPGYRTALSGPETKAMTHFLRSTHDAILIGVRTAIADDPGLNCRLAGAGGYGGVKGYWQPRPIIIDPTGRLIIRPEMKILKVAEEGRAKAPWIVVGPNVNLHPVAVSTLKGFGGEYLMINDMDRQGRFSWEGIFQVLYREGIKSIMVEGGGLVLSELLRKQYATTVDSVIMTIAPTFLGSMGVQVSQETEADTNRVILQNRLKDVFWQPIGSDVIVCGRPEQPPKSNGILQGILEMANADGANDQKHHPPPPAALQHQQRLPPISQLPGPPGPYAHHHHQGPPPQHNHTQPGPPPHHPDHRDRPPYTPAQPPQPSQEHGGSHRPNSHHPGQHRWSPPSHRPHDSPVGKQSSPRANAQPPAPVTQARHSSMHAARTDFESKKNS